MSRRLDQAKVLATLSTNKKERLGDYRCSEIPQILKMAPIPKHFIREIAYNIEKGAALKSYIRDAVTFDEINFTPDVNIKFHQKDRIFV